MNFYGKEMSDDEYFLYTGTYVPEQSYLWSDSSYRLVITNNADIEVIRPAWIVCDHCGIRNPDDSKTFYCAACGAPLPENQFLVRRYNDRRST